MCRALYSPQNYVERYSSKRYRPMIGGPSLLVEVMEPSGSR